MPLESLSVFPLMPVLLPGSREAIAPSVPQSYLPMAHELRATRNLWKGADHDGPICHALPVPGRGEKKRITYDTRATLGDVGRG